MLQQSDQRLAAIVGRLALTVALVVAIAFPLGYFLLSYRHEMEHVEAQAGYKAGIVTALISANPDLWMFQVQRLEELLARYPAPMEDEAASIRDASGKILVRTGAPPPAPVISRSRPLHDSGKIVGHLEIEHSYRGSLYGAAVIALLGLILGASAYLSLRVLPLRALRRVTEKLFLETEKWKFAMEGGGDGVWDWDLAKGPTLYSKTYLDMFGYTQEELQRPENTYDRRTHPEDLPRVKAALESYLEGRSDTYVVERRMRCKDGSWKWVRGRGMAVSRDAKGRVLRMIGTHTDISEQKHLTHKLEESDKLLRELSEQVPGIIFQFCMSAEGKFSLPFISTPYDDLWDEVSQDFSGDVTPLFDFVHPDDRAGFLASIFESASSLENWQRDYRVMLPERGLRWRSGHARPKRLPDGATVWHGFITDITDRVMAEELRQQLEGQLRSAQKIEAIGTLAAGVAHDFNNIIGTIAGNVALARQDVGAGHKALESLEEIQKASLRARNLVRQILTFSRDQPPLLSSQPLRPLVEETIQLLRSTLPAGVDLTVAIADTRACVVADATQLQQVLLNLSTNAWQALHERSGRIEIALEEVELDAPSAQRLSPLKPGPHLRMRVSDNGKGMDEATKARIFEPFFTTKPVGQGTGLGLAAVHGIVQTHGGAISVESAPGRGATFCVYLPVVAPPPAEPAQLPATLDGLRGSNQRVLYLDDDESLVFLVLRMLNRLGFRASGFHDARQALEAVRAKPGDYDIFVTDFNMPGLSGLDVALELARIRPDLPVVITSGYITDALRSEARRAGVRQLVDKPNTVDELCGVILKILLEG